MRQFSGRSGIMPFSKSVKTEYIAVATQEVDWKFL